MSPRVIMLLGGAVLMLSALIGAFFFGRSTGKDSMRAEYAKQLQKAEAGRKRAEARVAEVEASAAVAEVERQTTVREVYREIPKIIRGDPVYLNKCISDDGVRALDRAAAAANGESVGDAAGGAGEAAVGTTDGRPDDGEGDDQR